MTQYERLARWAIKEGRSRTGSRNTRQGGKNPIPAALSELTSPTLARSFGDELEECNL